MTAVDLLDVDDLGAGAAPAQHAEVAGLPRLLGERAQRRQRLAAQVDAVEEARAERQAARSERVAAVVGRARQPGAEQAREQPVRGRLRQRGRARQLRERAAVGPLQQRVEQRDPFTSAFASPLTGASVDLVRVILELCSKVPQMSPARPAREPVRGLLTIGESLALLTTRDPGRLRRAHELLLGVGGAESNAAIGVARLGGAATWVGRVGDDELGALVTRTLRAEGVEAVAIADPGAPTSLMLKERPSATGARVSYYRGGGPGARLTPADLDAEAIAAAGVLHLTGITPALSASARATVAAAIAAARAAGVPVSFDVNYRSRLWSPADAAPVLLELAARADHVFVGHDEAVALGWPGDPVEVGRALLERGPRVVVVKLGADGALAVTAEGELPVAPVPIVPVDPVGAGDAFAAGYLAELLAGLPLPARLRTAAACGAAACTARGDWEALPTRAELERLDAPAEVVR